MEEKLYSVTNSFKEFIYKVYAWMGSALLITAGVSYCIYHNPRIFNALFSNPLFIMIIFIAQLGLVILLSLLIKKMSYPQAIAAFLLYAISIGITFSALFYTYSLASLGLTFLVAASMFITMALYGYSTNADLSKASNYVFMALIGLIIGFLINIFLKNQTFDYVLSGFGVLLFTFLTAYDMQRITRMAQAITPTDEHYKNYALLGALTLYLDFLNLFLMLLRFTGRKK